MPIYEYTCQKCKAHIEIMQKVSDKPLARHSKCGGKLEKEWSQTSFQLKGSGWYVTDYAAKKPDSKEAREPSEGKEAKGEPAADKPANKTSDSDKASDKATGAAASEKTKEKTPKASASKSPAKRSEAGD